MTEHDKPCLLPHLKERLELTYGNEKEYYEQNLKDLRDGENLDERVEKEITEKLKAATDNLEQVRQMPTCPSPDPGAGEEQETSQDPPTTD